MRLNLNTCFQLINNKIKDKISVHKTKNKTKRGSKENNPQIFLDIIASKKKLLLIKIDWL